MEKHGSLDYSQLKVGGHTANARVMLESFPPSRAKSHLVELIDYLAVRYS